MKHTIFNQIEDFFTLFQSSKVFIIAMALIPIVIAIVSFPFIVTMPIGVYLFLWGVLGFLFSVVFLGINKLDKIKKLQGIISFFVVLVMIPILGIHIDIRVIVFPVFLILIVTLDVITDGKVLSFVKLKPNPKKRNK